ncbi:MAG: hypothetical protein ACI8UG_002045 [Gammaproteobacteria bacterium]|jgi:hypothetical protein
MKFKILKAAFAGLVLSVSSFVNAGIIYTFTFNDISPWVHVENIIAGDSLTITFGDSTDFNDLSWDDMESYQYNLAAGETYAVTNFTAYRPYNNFFSYLNDELSITYKNRDDFSYVVGRSANDYYAQIVDNGVAQMATEYDDVNGVKSWAELHTLDRRLSVTYCADGTTQCISGVDVNEPSTLAIFALGLMGLASRRFKKQA